MPDTPQTLDPGAFKQAVMPIGFLTGAAFPSRRTAAVLASLTLPLALLALATVRAKLS